MFIEIEIISGKILDLLDDKGKLNFHEVTENINKPEAFIAQGLQWLLRLGFITEDRLTGEYAINELQKVFKEEGLMVGSNFRK